VKNPEITIKAAHWSEHECDIRLVRHNVFVLEQSVPKDLDFDGVDPICCHTLAFSKNKAVATGRMEPDGHIGRIAVIKECRGCGIGSAIVRFFMDIAKRRKLDYVYLNAQISAVSFYEKLGFYSTGNIFIDAGIEHIRMEKISEQINPADAVRAADF